jgi:transcriptional regulator with PAS, ATPase and Fis domain
METARWDPECVTARATDIDPLTRAALTAVTRALASIGRAFICLDQAFRIVHASKMLDKLLGEGTSEQLPGRAIGDVLGDDLFGSNGPLKEALIAGERREGWRGTLQFQGGVPHLVSLTVAPLEPESAEVCDPSIAYILVLRPAAEEEMPGSNAPTFFSGAIANSAAMLQVFRLVENLQHSEATVLITGESGTGKEVVARAIHQHSPRRDGAFVAVNCGALPGELLESELFGHARGAFTGAHRDRIGRFELASNGTLFLDEIGDLSLPLQVKLLRVLQERTFERVGESVPRTSNARIIAATNLDLRRSMAEGRFREDLFYRLRVVPIEIPPLRNRREDIQPLAHHLLTRISRQNGLVKRLSPQAMRVLLDYAWPGNVRELANAIEYAMAVSRKETILPEDLPKELQEGGTDSKVAAVTQPRPVDSEESRRLRATLEAHHWRRDAAARALGLSRSTLWRRMKELNLG